MRITVLGGAGKMGCIAVQTLANDSRIDEVVIADINMEQAQVVADTIPTLRSGTSVGGGKISLRQVDIRDQDAFVAALRGSDACLNATVYYTNLAVMAACRRAGVPYVDLGGLFHTTRKQLELHDAFAEAGVAAVLGMGSAPGIPNVQARYAAERLDSIDTIRIYDGIKPPPADQVLFTYAVPTILDEMTLQPMVFRDGQFLAREPLSELEDYWFTPPLGLLPMHLSLHSEVATLPITYADKGVRECFFKINYWGMARETVEKIQVLSDLGFDSRQPIAVSGQPVVPRDVMMALLSERVPPITDFLKPPARRGGFGDVDQRLPAIRTNPPLPEPPNWQKEIVSEVRGMKDGQAVTYRVGTLTLKGALPTGAAPAITAIWLAQGRIPPGVHPPEQVLEPEPFFRELDRLGIPTQVSVSRPLK